jgi:MoaA/NifB/PqqE/SkfB family radical SAM enzyme
MTGIDTLCIEIISRCPLRCVHCSANASPERTEKLSRAAFGELLRELRSAEELFISGGEPFEHPELATFIAHARKVAKRVVVYSSGVRLDAGYRALHFDEVQRAADAGMSRVDLSFYAATPELHDDVTTLPGSFMLTVESAARLRRAGVPFGVHFVPIGENGSQAGAVADLAVRIGASRLHVLALTPQGRGRFLETEIRRETLNELGKLRDRRLPLELVLSSEIRRQLGSHEKVQRDLLQPAFFDVRGFLYPSEGQRAAQRRSASSFLAGATLTQLVGELGIASCAAV